MLVLALLLSSCNKTALQSPLPAFPWQPPIMHGKENTISTRPENKAINVSAEQGKGGNASRSVSARSDIAGNGEIELVPTAKNKAMADLQGWVQSARSNEPITRTVLEDFLPKSIDGFERQVTESHAHAPNASDVMQQTLTTSALARVENYDKKNRSRFIHITIEDLAGLGEPLASKLLAELESTGGESSSEEGRVQRLVSLDDHTITMQECFIPFRQCKLEVLVDQRYQIRAESSQLEPEELRRYVAQIDFASLSARAKNSKPVE
jgi:hypothetical protein